MLPYLRQIVPTAALIVLASTLPKAAYAGSAGNGAAQRNGTTSVTTSAGPSAVPVQDASSKLTVTVEPVGSGRDVVQQGAFSDNGLHVAYVGPAGSRWTGIVDGKGGNKFDQVSTFGNLAPPKQFIFSADGTHCAYTARRGQDQFIVVDGQETPLNHQSWEVTEATFSPDGSQFACAVNPQHAEASVILNGKDGPHCFGVKSLQFSSDSKHFAYISNNSEKTKSAYHVVMDGQTGPEFAGIPALMFSPDGQHWGYIGHEGTPYTGEKSHLFIDGKEFAAMDDISGFQFSRDGQHVMYFAGKKQGDKKDGDGRPLYDRYICLDAQQWPYAPVRSSAIEAAVMLSPDGKRVAYVESAAAGAKGALVTVNGQRGLEYESISQIQFSPDGQHIAYLAVQGLNQYGAGGRGFVVYDGNESDAYSMGEHANALTAMSLKFSPDGKHFAYTARDPDHAFVVSDGKKGADYDRVMAPVVFSPDGAHLAYFASRDVLKNATPIQRQQAMAAPNFDPGNYVVLDGQEQRLPPKTTFSAGTIHFSPDGKHSAYLAAGQTSGAIAVVDGRIVKFTEGESINNLADAAWMFSPDSKHVIYAAYTSKGGVSGVGVDGDMVEGYTVAAYTAGSAPLIGFVAGNKMQYFAHVGMNGPMQRVTVDLGPERNFGTVDSTATAIAAQPAQPAPAANSPQQNSTATNQNPPSAAPPAHTPPPANRNPASDAAQKASDIFNIFKHH